MVIGSKNNSLVQEEHKGQDKNSLDPYVLDSVKYYALKLVKTGYYLFSDLEDLEHEMILYFLNENKKYKYNGRKEELEEEYQRTHNGEYNESKIIDCFYPELKSIRLKLDKYDKWERNGQPIIDLELMDKLTEEERQIVFSYEEYKELRKEWEAKNKEKEEKEKKKYKETKGIEKNNGNNDNNINNNNGEHHDKQ
jgi:hypothetical protein